MTEYARPADAHLARMERIIGELKGSDDRLLDRAQDLYAIMRELNALVRKPPPAGKGED